MIVTLLGTGTSHGVPVLGCNCPTCTSEDFRDIRTRSSAYIQAGGLHILIDTATELRLQSLKNQISRVDLALITHNHADHISGFDDLRRFNELQAGEINVFGSQSTLRNIEAMFPYIFDEEAQVGGGKPRVRLTDVAGAFEVSGVKIIPIPVIHGRIPVFGYRIGNFAYVTDCSEIPDASFELLNGLDLLILGVLRFRSHPTHLNLEEGLEVIRKLRPGQCLLTHLAHDFKHGEVDRILPEGVSLGYDGQKVELQERECKII
jgi:phosphoribosyl 1,2-cyclic phosphate phosphodiesterase